MPVEGIPDRARHRLCFRCQRWFHPHEGTIDYPPVRGPASFVLDKLARALEDESRLRFYCDACHRASAQDQERGRASGRWTLIATLAMAVLLAVLWWCGVFDGLLPRR